MFTLKKSPLPALHRWHVSFLAAVIAVTCLGGTACSRKSGCPINETATLQTDKKGNVKSGKGSSNLFPKDMRKRMKKS